MHDIGRALCKRVLAVSVLSLTVLAGSNIGAANAAPGPVIVPTKKCWEHTPGATPKTNAIYQARITRQPNTAGITSWSLSIKIGETGTTWTTVYTQGGISPPSSEEVVNKTVDITSHVANPPPPAGTGSNIYFKITATDATGTSEIDPIVGPCIGTTPGVPAASWPTMVALATAITAVSFGLQRRRQRANSLHT